MGKDGLKSNDPEIADAFRPDRLIDWSTGEMEQGLEKSGFMGRTARMSRILRSWFSGNGFDCDLAIGHVLWGAAGGQSLQAVARSPEARSKN